MAAAPDSAPATALSLEIVKRIADAYASLPQGFTVHPRLKPQIDKRIAMATEGGIDWAFGELLAFGSLVLEGVPVRLSGQDTRRATFSQRHSVLVDRDTGQEHTPLKYLDDGQAPFWVYDSLLSEFAAMGFEYGYSVANPKALVLWEAQFGDFAGGAQTIVDEFVAAGEAKWAQRSRLTLLLPHGYEGQGPDHSSARPERFLQLCAEINLRLVNCTTASQYFHLLRRQGGLLERDPLPPFVLTPKSLLRHPAVASTPRELQESRFRSVIDDPDVKGRYGQIRRLVLCSGKVFVDLIASQRRAAAKDVAIVRLEQLYPFPSIALREAL